jgi:hypothetical protein
LLVVIHVHIAADSTSSNEEGRITAMICSIPVICSCLVDRRLRLSSVRALLALLSRNIHSALTAPDLTRVCQVLFSTICSEETHLGPSTKNQRLKIDSSFFPKVCRCIGELLSTLLQKAVMISSSAAGADIGRLQESSLLETILAAFSCELGLQLNAYAEYLNARSIKRSCAALVHSRGCLAGLRYMLDSLLFPTSAATNRKSVSDAEEGDEDGDGSSHSSKSDGATSDAASSGANAEHWRKLSKIAYFEQYFGSMCVQFMSVLGSFLSVYRSSSTECGPNVKVETNLSRVALAIASIQSSILDAGVKLPDMPLFLGQLQHVIQEASFPMGASCVLIRACENHCHDQQASGEFTAVLSAASPRQETTHADGVLAYCILTHVEKTLGATNASTLVDDDFSEMLLSNSIESFRLAHMLASKRKPHLLFHVQATQAQSTDLSNSVGSAFVALTMRCTQQLGRHSSSSPSSIPQSGFFGGQSHVTINKLLRTIGLFWDKLCGGGTGDDTDTGDTAVMVTVRTQILIPQSPSIFSQLLLQACFCCDVKQVLGLSGLIETLLLLLHREARGQVQTLLNNSYVLLADMLTTEMSKLIPNNNIATGSTRVPLIPESVQLLHESGIGPVLTMVFATILTQSTALYTSQHTRNHASINKRNIIRKIFFLTRKSCKVSSRDSSIVWNL